MRIINVLLTVLFVLSSITFARIIRVPGQEDNIQLGINAARDGDTVLVSNGQWVGAISFRGKDITVASRYIIAQNPGTIENTLISATWGDSTVSFNNDETSDAHLIGFTINNGRAPGGGGGGVYINDASPVISHCIIAGNMSLSHGAGIYITGGAEPTIEYTLIRGNQATRDGGGVYVNASHPTFHNVTLTQNNAERNGGGIFIDGNSRVTASRLLIYGNGADEGGGMFLSSSQAGTYDRMTVINNATDEDDSGALHVDDGDVTFVNSIIWDNGVRTIYAGNRYSDDLTIDYCDVADGEDGIEAPGNRLHYGDNNIDQNPRFVDPHNDDFRISENSPCVDAGDPEADPDPDGTRADIGFYALFQTATLYGFIYDAATREPVAGEVTTYYETSSQSAMTDERGFWEIEDATIGDFYLTATARGYNDSTLFDLQVEPDEELQIDTVFLLHPTFSISDEQFGANLEPGDSASFEFSVTNDGNGTLFYETQKRITGDVGMAPWTHRERIAAGDTLTDDHLSGVVLVGDRYYVAGGSPDTSIVDSTDYNYVYVLDREGSPVDHFRQWGTTTYGIGDMAYDGELLWGVERAVAYGFTTDGDSVTSFEGPRSLQGIAWDSDRELMWICAQTSDIWATDLEGNVQLTVDRRDLRIRGLAYWPDDPDGYPLYVYHKDRDNNEFVYKIDPTANDGDGDTMFVHRPQPDNGRGGESSFITNSYDDIGSWVFIGMTNVRRQEGNDEINVYQLQSYSGWIQLEPQGADTLIPGSERNYLLWLNSNGPEHRFVLPEDVYQAEILFTHNAMGEQFVLPVTMNVTTNAVEHDRTTLPDDFSISTIYPNPFNSTATIRYSIPHQSFVTLELYDIQGRMVSLLVDDTVPAGLHTISLSADAMPSGVYFLKLSGSDATVTQKVLLMK